MGDLGDALDGLPDGALVPVGWIRDQLRSEPADEEDGVADLTVQEVADELDRAPSTVRGWLGEGELDGYRFRGREWRITREALQAFLEEERNGDGSRSGGDLGSWREEVAGGGG